jgi:hypothetical protein
MIAWWWLIVGAWATGCVGVLLGVRLGMQIATLRMTSRSLCHDQGECHD